MLNFLKAIGGFFKKVFSSKTAAALQRAVEASAPYVETALVVVKTLTAMTPTRADDEIVAAIEKYAVPIIWNKQGDRATVLRDIAVAAIKQKFPTASNSDLNRAVELAVGAVKNGA